MHGRAHAVCSERKSSTNGRPAYCLGPVQKLRTVAMSLPVASRLLRRALKTQLVPVANVTSKPAKNNITAADQAIAITILFGSILAPSSWILAHLEDYKNKK